MNGENKSKCEELFNQGLEKLAKQDFLTAKSFFLQAEKIFPGRESVIYNLALTNYLLNDYESCEEIIEKLYQLNSNDYQIIKLFISVLSKKYSLEKIVELIFKINSEQEINNKDDLINLFEDISSKFVSLGLELSKKFYQKYLSLDKKNLKIFIESMLLLPSVLESNEDENKIRQIFEENIQTIETLKVDEFNNIEMPNTLPFFLSYSYKNNKIILKKYTKCLRKVFKNLNYAVNFVQNISTSKIKIGFISRFFTDHTVGKLFYNLPLKLDKNIFNVVVFHSSYTKKGLIKNEIDLNLKTICLPTSFEKQKEIIEKEKLDIIFYPDIGMATDLYYLTFLRLAKIQITSFGHPETSGNKTIDYFISNKLSEIESAHNHYSEKLICFKNFHVFYKPPKFYKKEVINNSQNNIYSCLQSIMKLHPRFDDVIHGILKSDSRATVTFLKDENGYQYKLFFERLKKKKIDIERIKFLERMNTNDFINTCGNSNVMLDPFFFGAGNTFIEQFVYPVPIVTCPNDYLRSRIALGLYSQLKIENPPVCSNTEEYISTAVELANNKKKNNFIREQISCNSKFFFENQNVLVEYENFFKQIVHTS